MTDDNCEIADQQIADRSTERAPLSASLLPMRLAFRRSGPLLILAVIGLSIVAHAVILLLVPHVILASNILIGIAFLAAALACVQQLQIGTVETRRLWALLASAFLLSVVGQAESTIDALSILHRTTAFTADFFFLVYGIPVVLAISTPNEDVGLRSLFWFDVIPNHSLYIRQVADRSVRATR